jgi:hypothetical protein
MTQLPHSFKASENLVTVDKFTATTEVRRRMCLPRPMWSRGSALALLLLLTNPALLFGQPEKGHPQFVCRPPGPQLAPAEAACTLKSCIVKDGSWDTNPIADGTACTVPSKGPGTCQQGWCNACQIPTAAGSILPKYVVIGVIYSPPGCTGCPSEASVVDYTNANTIGTTLSTENSFNQDYTLSLAATIFGNGREISGDYSTTETTNASQTIANTQQTGLKATGNQDGINHDQDTIIILLNPSISVYSGENFHPFSTGGCIPAIQWRTGIDGPSAQPYPLTVQELKNFAGLPANVAALMQAHGINQDDFNTMLLLDPFVSGPAPIDGSRYVQTAFTFPYKPPDTNLQQCNGQGVCSCMVWSNQKIENELTTNVTSPKTSYGVGFKESAGFDIKLLSVTDTATQKFTWTATASKTNTTSSSKSATVTIPCPSPNWKNLEDYTQIDVYWDTWYGSFMFSPSSPVEDVAGSNTFLNGHIADKTGQPMRHEPVDVSANGITHHTITDSRGDYSVYGIKVTKNSMHKRPNKLR